MSEFDSVKQKILRKVSDNSGMVSMPVDWIARAVVDEGFNGSEDADTVWLALNMCKQMVRQVLGAKFDADGRDNAAHQGDMFHGELQDRYPIPRAAGESPVYKLRHALSVAEIDWNIGQLMKSADARKRHADALAAYRDSRQGDAGQKSA